MHITPINLKNFIKVRRLYLSALEEWMAAFHFGGKKPGIGRQGLTISR